MKQVNNKLALLNAIHDRKILFRTDGMYLEITEESLIQGLALDRYKIDITYYTVKSGDDEIIVINRITRMVKDIYSETHTPSTDETPWTQDDFPLDRSA